MGAGLGESIKGPFGPILNEPPPSIFGRPFSSRAFTELVKGAVGLEQELLAIEYADIGGSIPGRLKFTNEALLDEASGYPVLQNLSLSSLGLQGSSYSTTPFLGHNKALLVSERASSGLEGSAEGVMGRDPLRIILAKDFSALDGRKEPS